MPILHSAARGQDAVNVLEIFIAIFMDFITAYEFGLSCSSNFLENEQERKRWSALYVARRPYAFWGHEAPWLQKLLANIGIHVVPRTVEDGIREIEDRILATVEKAEARFEREIAWDYEGDAEVYCQMRRAVEKEEAKGDTTGIRTNEQRRREIAAELSDDTCACRSLSKGSYYMLNILSYSRWPRRTTRDAHLPRLQPLNPSCCPVSPSG